LIPLRDNIPSTHFPLMTIALIVINTVVFYYQSLHGLSGMEELFSRFALIPANFDLDNILSQPLSHYSPLITSTFLHGGFMHLLSNMWALWLFGDNVEDRMGSFNFLVFYLFCGILAGSLHVLIYPASTIPTIGASGAIAGIMGSYFILFPHAKVLTLIPIVFIPWFVEIYAVIYLGFWLFLQILGGTAELAGGVAQIAFWVHVGGFVAGMIFHRFFIIDRPVQS